MDAVIGIDGGATRTRAVLATLEGKMLGYGQGGPTNYDDVGITTARQNLATAIQQSLLMAGSRAPDITTVFLGMAGVVSQSDRNNIIEIASGVAPIARAAIHVDHDIQIAHAGGLAGEPGIALIVGTGSSCYGTNRQGQALRVGGWGHLLDDGGSSYYLGLQAIIATIRAADGRSSLTQLSEEVLHRLGIADVQEVMWRVYHKGLQPVEIAALAPLVTRAAEEGDVEADRIIANGITELVQMVEVAARRLGYTDVDTSLAQTQTASELPSGEHTLAPGRIVLTGGLVQSSRLYRHKLLTAIQSRLPGLQVMDPILPPVFGAVLLALKAAGAPAHSEQIEALRKWAAMTII